jgi:2-haloacid dehalogenase
MNLADFDALSFDCYGTLIDWETGIASILVPWAREAGLDLTEEELLLAYAGNEEVVEREIPTALYSTILAESLRRFGAKLGAAVPEELADRFGASVPTWPAFPDSPAALKSLSERYKLIILSNVHREGFAASNERLGVKFDKIITAEDVGAYKPAPNHFEALGGALDELNVPRKSPPARRAKPVPRPCPGEAPRHSFGMDQSPPRPPRMGGHSRADRGIQLRNGIPIDGGLRSRCARQQRLTPNPAMRYPVVGQPVQARQSCGAAPVAVDQGLM